MNAVKKFFEAPEMNVVNFSVMDIVTTSGDDIPECDNQGERD